MNWTETALTFSCAGEHLVGVICVPERRAGPGVLIVVGGPQYRAGSHRQFVHLARGLAQDGYAVMRFDCRGMGDSEGALRTFEQISDDIDAAIDAFARKLPELTQFVLWGLCDGASAALLYLDERGDRRVKGVCLMNPWVRSDESLAKTQVKHYYVQRLTQAAFWAKLIRGQIGLGALSQLWRSLRMALAKAPANAGDAQRFQQRMARAWSMFSGPVLLLLSELDFTANEFVDYTASDPAWRGAIETRQPTRAMLAGADHTCSQPGAQDAALRLTVNWLRGALAPIA
jgi:uncharacterized protein